MHVNNLSYPHNTILQCNFTIQYYNAILQYNITIQYYNTILLNTYTLYIYYINYYYNMD